MAVDGKCLRRSHDRAKGLGPLHLVSVWLSYAGLTLAQTVTDTKSNEITRNSRGSEACGHERGDHLDRCDGDTDGNRRTDR